MSSTPVDVHRLARRIKAGYLPTVEETEQLADYVLHQTDALISIRLELEETEAARRFSQLAARAAKYGVPPLW